jgi:hypothetical protein
LKLNPFLWKSFESLCQRGDNPDPASIFTLSNIDNFVQSQGLNPILQYANSLATQQQQQHTTALPTTTTTALHNFAPHANSGSVTSTPITNSSSQQHQQQPIKSFAHPGQVNCIEVTPQQHQQQQNGLPVPQLMMSMITPVHNQIESTLGGLDSCFTGYACCFLLHY